MTPSAPKRPKLPRSDARIAGTVACVSLMLMAVLTAFAIWIAG